MEVRGKRLASLSGRGNRLHVSIDTKLVSPRVGLDVVTKRMLSVPAWESNSDRQAQTQSLDWAELAYNNSCNARISRKIIFFLKKLDKIIHQSRENFQTLWCVCSILPKYNLTVQ
jgi:hypothetical protein